MDYVHVNKTWSNIRKVSKTNVKYKNMYSVHRIHIKHVGNLVNNAVPSPVQFLITAVVRQLQ